MSVASLAARHAYDVLKPDGKVTSSGAYFYIGSLFKGPFAVDFDCENDLFATGVDVLTVHFDCKNVLEPKLHTHTCMGERICVRCI